MVTYLLIGAGYLAGSIPFGVLLTRKVRGIDVRSQGSGNIGATNVARVAGKKLGAFVLLLDAAKGAIPVLAATLLLPNEPKVHAVVGLTAFLGHVYPVWLRFRGGKGVATALGVLLILSPYAALAGAFVYAGLFAAFKVSSIGSLAGAIVAFAVSAVRGPLEYAALTGILVVLILFRHRSNIARLIRRTEKKI
jgi:acyl phosphate:glycerol-3-phosphate acyltransferase